MKILYIGSERSDAEAVTTTLRDVDRACTVSWASCVEHGARWLNENRDVAALIVDAHANEGNWQSILPHRRTLPTLPALIVILPEESGLAFETLHPEADDYIPKGDALTRDLPLALRRAVSGREVSPSSSHPEPCDQDTLQSEAQVEALLALERSARAELERKLADATTALEHAEQRHRAAMEAADKQLADQRMQYEIGMARAAATWDMVDEQLRMAAQDVERARQSRAAADADVARLSICESELLSQLADAAASHRTLERRLADAEAALDAAKVRTEHERLAAAERLTQRERGLEAQIAQTVDELRRVENLRAHAERACDQAEQRHASASTEAAAHARELNTALQLARQEVESKEADVERLVHRETELTSLLAEVGSSRSDLERRLAATEAAFDDATTRATRDRLAASKKAAEREADLDAQIRQEQAARAAVEQQLAAQANENAERQAHLERELSIAAAERDRVMQQVRDAEATLDQMRHDHQAATSEMERLVQDEARLQSQLAELETARHALECQLTKATSAIDRAAARQAELDERILYERTARASAEQAAAATTASLHEALQQHEAAIAVAATERAECQVRFDRALSEVASDRDRLAHRLNESEAALEQLRREHHSAIADIKRLTDREADLTSQLADLQAVRRTLEQRLADSAWAMADTDGRVARERAAAANRQTDLETRLAQETAARASLEQAVADGQAALRVAQQQHEEALTTKANELMQRSEQFDRERSELAAARDRLTQLLTDTQATLDQTRLDHQSAAAEVERLQQRETELKSQLVDAHATREALGRQLADAERTMADATAQTSRERAAAAERQAEMDARLVQEVAARTVLEQTLEDARAAAQDAERSHRTEVDSLRAQAQEQQTQFVVRLGQERIEHETRLAHVDESRRTLALERDALEQSRVTLQEQAAHLERDLDVANRRLDALQHEADQLPALQQQLAESRAESHRLFEQATLAMFRCSRDGALTHANRACASLIGRRTLEELRGTQFAAAVFESPNILSWLIESCAGSRAKESVETTWRRKDGGHLFVRLSARMTGDLVEIVAEDLTRLRVLQQRLAQGHRMEAVGRFASEVAVTCSTLLGDVHEKGREWLATLEGGDARHQGELLLGEVRRAAGLLQQLEACGDEQERAPTLVDLNTLIRDLEPVLKRVAGGDVEIQLRDTSSPLNVDVRTERVERLFVNLAGYGRQRMPFGGGLRIELGTSIVDRHFAAQHPNVRLGVHALITVTEVRRTDKVNETARDRDRKSEHGSNEKATRRAGVDFGRLQELVSECGGHLWIQVQPRGDMIAKIRLPLVVASIETHPRTAAARSGRERPLARWFQS